MTTENKKDAAEALDVSAGSALKLHPGFLIPKTPREAAERITAPLFSVEARIIGVSPATLATAIIESLPNTRDDRRRATDSAQPNGA